ncbi:hypothetical protein RRG08_052596 [Elysia crispata]|uniref:Torsin-1A-interacting protein 1/2 AAA+ activator domain-containing protein n=1 Tax=Elysia crispata TaxID=231223 RepID=A0AAE1A174_9GAST|nr:hypothetical protein RRG08_052596 [Elysia crispata]
MPGRIPISPKSRSHRSPSSNKQTADLSESEEDVNISGHNYSRGHSTSSPSFSHVSSQDDSVQDEDDFQENSYSKSTHQSDSKLRSRVRTRTQGSSSTSPRTPGKMYPDLSDSMSGDGPSHKGESGKKYKPCYPKLEKGDIVTESTQKMGLPEEEEQDESSISLNKILLVVVLILIAIILLIFYRSPKPVEDTADISIFEKYITSIDYLQKEFPQQSPRLWRTLKSSAKHVLNATDPEYPVVVLMAALTPNQLVTRCIAEQVASLYQAFLTGDSTNVKTSDMSQYKNLQDARQKETLDNEMTQAFSENGGKSFLIVNLQALAPEAALILHGFCDNDNAPYKDVMILMTLHFSFKDLQLNEKQKFGEEDVEMYLRNLWGRGLVADKVGALLSRVGNNIVIIGEETNASVKNFCKI